MPIEIRDVDGGVGVIITSKGLLTEKEWMDALHKHLTQAEKKFKKYRYSLSDYTAVTKTEITIDAIHTVAGYCESASRINPKSVVATVAHQDYIYGMSRMWEILVNSTDWETMVFRNREHAEAWLSKRVKEKYRIDHPTFN